MNALLANPFLHSELAHANGDPESAIGLYLSDPTVPVAANFNSAVTNAGYAALDLEPTPVSVLGAAKIMPPVEIRLSGKLGGVSIIDGTDAELVAPYKWVLFGGYAYTQLNRSAVSMHRLIMNPPAGMQIDHVNGQKLDNRRCNLRLCTRQQNMSNCARPAGKSGFRGVFPHYGRDRSAPPKFRAIIKFHGKRHCSRTCADPRDAAVEYDILARKLHGEFAVLNFPEGRP